MKNPNFCLQKDKYDIQFQKEEVRHQGLLLQLNQSLNRHQISTIHQQVTTVKQEHLRELQSLKLSTHLLQSTYKFNLQQLNNKYQELAYQKDCLAAENLILKQQVQRMHQELLKNNQYVWKMQQKITNQEGLIDQYKRSVDEQIGLQKQVIKAEFMEKQLMSKVQFDKALQSMQQNYHRKLDQFRNKSSSEFKTIKKQNYRPHQDKENILYSFHTKNKSNKKQCVFWKQKTLKRASEANISQLKSSSSYSTLDK